MPREKSTPKKNSMKAQIHSAKERRKTHGFRHQIFDISDKAITVKNAKIGDLITLQTDNQMGVKTWRVRRGLKSKGQFVNIAQLVSDYDGEHHDSDETASEESAGNSSRREESAENSSRGGKSRRRKSRKSRKTRKSFYNWS